MSDPSQDDIVDAIAPHIVHLMDALLTAGRSVEQGLADIRLALDRFERASEPETDTASLLDRTGWFVDVADEDDAPVGEEYRWQAVLQLRGRVAPLPEYHRTEAEALRFLKEEVIGQGILD